MPLHKACHIYHEYKNHKKFDFLNIPTYPRIKVND